MAGPRIKGSLIVTADPRLYLRDHNKFMRNAFRHAAVIHHQKHIPRHFMPIAAVKYGYKKRTSRVSNQLSYQELKDRLGLPPLVSPRKTSGLTRQVITTQRRVTATRKGSRLILRLPFRGGTGSFRLVPGQKKLTQRQEEVQQRIAEIETIAVDEQNTLNKIIGERYTQLANTPGVAKKVRMKSSKTL